MDTLLVKPSSYKKLQVTVVGQSPGLIMNQFSEKAKGDMGKIHKGEKNQREARDEEWIKKKWAYG